MIHDEKGFLIVISNSERCRDCGGDDQNIWYEDRGESGKVKSAYALCRLHDPKRPIKKEEAVPNQDEQTAEGFEEHVVEFPVWYQFRSQENPNNWYVATMGEDPTTLEEAMAYAKELRNGRAPRGSGAHDIHKTRILMRVTAVKTLLEEGE